MIALGLDPSLRAYGWAIVDISAEGRLRRISSGHEGTLKTHVPPARFLHFQALVKDLLDRYPEIDVVGIESPAYSAGPFQSIHFGLLQFSMASVFHARKDCVLFDPATREYLVRQDPKLNKGKVQKSDVQRYVQLDTMDTEILNDNEADAYVIGKFAARFMCLIKQKLSPDDLTVSEKRVFLEKKKSVKNLSGKTDKRTAHAFRENDRFFMFSQIPEGDPFLPKKSNFGSQFLDYLESGQDPTK